MDINENKDFKIYCIADEKERIDYIQNNTNALNYINLAEVKQIETDYYNKVYVLLNNGNIYIDNTYFVSDISSIYCVSGLNIYLITNDNRILPIKDVVYWDNLDFYLNNNYEKYKKILTHELFLTALTGEKKVIAVTKLIEHGTIPENFFDVDDILSIDEEPYIIKNNKTIPLYAMPN